MADKCPPVRLPIHIETSCGSSCGPKSECGCSIKSNCDANCTINSVTSSQNTYQNSCTSVKQLPSLDIAYLSNVRNDCQPDLSVTLNPTSLSWCDFLTLFYRANNVFSINPSNQTACAISFVSQTYENTTSETLKLNLAQQIRIAWATKCETLVDNIPPKTNILLNKDTFTIRSLVNSTSSTSLTLDQAIATLLSNGEIAPADNTFSAEVRFVVQYKYYFKPLNVSILVNFVFITKIPCYKNVNFCDEWCPIYSNDKNCRACADLTDETVNIEKFLHGKSYSDTASVESSNDLVDNFGEDHSIGSSIISRDTSKWTK